MANPDLWWLLLPAILLILIVLMVLVSRIKASKRKARLRSLWDSREKDVVTLHMFDRALNCPNTSPFPIKLELYLRMTGIK